jgi:hypothetical protein
MNVVITSVDHAPDDLDGQLPLRARLLGRIAKRDPSNSFRSASGEYWLAALTAPVSWTDDGVTRTICHLVLAARWQGTAIFPGATLPVGIAYVIDDSVVSSESFDLTRATYVAIGMARVSGPSAWSKIKGLWARWSFPTGR